MASSTRWAPSSPLALASIGLPFWLLLLLVPLVMLPVGYIVERGLIQRVFHTGERHVTTLLLTFGLGLVLEDTFRLVFGPNPHRPETPITGGVEAFGIFLPSYRLFLIVIGSRHHRRGRLRGLPDAAGRHGARRGL